jgi:hypothetical protein
VSCTCPLTPKGEKMLIDESACVVEVVPEFRRKFPERASELTDEQIVKYLQIVLAKMRRKCPVHGGN